MATRMDIEIKRGDDVAIELTVTDDGTPKGEPVDISGWNFELTIRRQRDEADSVAVLLNKAGEIVSPTNPAVYRYQLSDDETLALQQASGRFAYWWDSRRTNAGAEAVLTEGRCMVVNTAGGRSA